MPLRLPPAGFTPTKPEVSPGTPDIASTGKWTPGGAEFIDIVTFDKLAATCGEWLTKGREVAVAHPTETGGFSGDPGFRQAPPVEWTGRDGERRSKAQVVAAARDERQSRRGPS